MVGVAGPMFRRSRIEGMRFLAGFTLGQLMSALFLSVAIIAIGMVVAYVFPWQFRITLFAAGAVLLALADKTGRTPQVSRQVPVDLYHRLESGRLGFAWGADVGLLFTTQKTSSMPWLGLLAATMLVPTAALPMLMSLALASAASLLVGVIRWDRKSHENAKQYFTRLKLLRFSSAALIPAFCLLLLVSAA